MTSSIRCHKCQSYSLCIRFVPESVRWLISKGKHQEAKELIQKVAKANKVDLSEGMLSVEKLLEDEVRFD